MAIKSNKTLYFFFLASLTKALLAMVGLVVRYCTCDDIARSPNDMIVGLSM